MVRLSSLRPKTRCGRDLDRDEEVAGRAAVLAGRALALEPDPLAVLDARPGCGPGWCAPRCRGRSRGRSGRPRRRPAGARRRRGQVSFIENAAARRWPPRSRRPRTRADVRPGAGLAAGALAGRAGGVGGQPQRDRDAVEGVDEADGRRRSRRRRPGVAAACCWVRPRWPPPKRSPNMSPKPAAGRPARSRSRSLMSNPPPSRHPAGRRATTVAEEPPPRSDLNCSPPNRPPPAPRVPGVTDHVVRLHRSS